MSLKPTKNEKPWVNRYKRILQIPFLPITSKYPQSIHSIPFPSYHPQPNARPPSRDGRKKKKKSWVNKRKSMYVFTSSQAIPNPTPLTAPPLFPLSLILLPSINPLSPLFCNPTTQLTPPPQISSPPCVVIPFAVLI